MENDIADLRDEARCESRRAFDVALAARQDLEGYINDLSFELETLTARVNLIERALQGAGVEIETGGDE